MKQIAQYQDGRLELQIVPEPSAPPGGILVRTTHSVISPGTEKMKVEQAKMSLLAKARARPDQVRKVLDSARTLGWRAALEKVRNRLESPTPLGYSAAGTVIAVDALNTRFRVGDQVAVGGAECAFHAEMLAIPDLLAAKVPDGVANSQAAYTTLVSISMHAVRQAGVGLGDRVLVIGQGLVGLLCTALLQAAGARVMASDLAASRLEKAAQMGAEKCVSSNLQDHVREWTDGYGVDAVLVCVSVPNNGPVEQSVKALRDRGVLVIVGIQKAELDWKEVYIKEIEVRYSRSYGPGRYDPSYEWGGSDYPIGYVRWTEQRNFESALHLMKTGQLDVDALTTRTAAFGDAPKVYDELMQSGNTDIGVVLTYGDAPRPAPAAVKISCAPALPAEAKIKPVEVLDVIGAGNFARTMLLPHLKERVKFGIIANNTALSARHVKEKFGFQSAESGGAQALTVDGHRGVLISTRHHLHAPMVVEGLKKGRHIFVEKPLCLTRGEMAQIDEAAAASQGTVMVGFNRRFAPATVEVMKALRGVAGPKTCAFHVGCGALNPEHWYANYAESGGRVLGEACHFFDFFCHLFGTQPVRVSAQTTWPPSGRLPFPDSITAQVEFADGSCGQLIYSAEGDSSFPKEVFTVYAAGLVAHCENFLKLSIHRGRKEATHKFASKGHAEEMKVWAAFLRGEAAHPLPYAQSRTSMHVTFGALESIQQAGAVEL